MYEGYPECKFWWAIKKKQEYITQFREAVTVKFEENAGKVT
jgi:ssDNA-binding Zn-finger/Zn-ribbon topoisomerase 1